MSEILVIVDSVAKGVIFDDYFGGRAEIVICQAPPLQPVYKPRVKGAVRPNFTFKELPTGREIMAKIREAFDKEIYLALDNDSKSEYCAWQISVYAQQMSKARILVRRLILHGLTKDEIDESLRLVHAVDEHLGIDFYTRALFDTYFTQHLTRLIGTQNGPGNLPLNFNSLSMVFSLGDRESDVKMYSPPEKWQVVADLCLEGQTFTAQLEGAADLTTDGFFKEMSGAEKAVEFLQDDKFIVDDVRCEALLIPPPPPYKMVELLHDAFVLCGIQPKETLETVSKLFHGVEVHGKTTGLISSFYSLAYDQYDPEEKSGGSDWQAGLRRQVINIYGEGALGEGLSESVSKLGLVYPLLPEISGTDLTMVLTPQEIAIYDLLCYRALASQMRPATGKKIRVEIAAGPESLFLANFRNVTDRGFMDMYKGNMDTKSIGSSPMADISEGDEFALLRLTSEQSVSMPASYTIESLFADLEDFGIVVEPFNILLLDGMIEGGYIDISKDGYLRPGDKNIQVETIMKRVFPGMQGINLSAYIEQTMAEVTSGRKEIVFALKQFDQTLMGHGKSLVKAKVPFQLQRRKKGSSHIIKQADEEAAERTMVSAPSLASSSDVVQEPVVLETPITEPEKPSSPEEEVVEVKDEPASLPSGTVPEAESSEVVAEIVDVLPKATAGEDTWSGELQMVFERAMEKTPEVGDQSSDLECDMPESGEVVVTEQGKQCPVCGQLMLLKKDRFGQFWSCSAFPKCRHSEAYSGADALKMLCPLCGEGKITQKRTPVGKNLYICPESDCEFMAWAKPYCIPCQVCDSPYLVEKKSRDGTIDLRCPKAGCDYRIPLPGSGEVAVPTGTSKPKKKKVRVRRVTKGSVAKKKRVRVVRRKK